MIDLTFLKEFTNGDAGKMKRYISLYVDVAPKTFQEMEGNLNDKNWEQLGINAHSLKPQAEYMGILTLRNELEKIEVAVRENKFSNVREHFELAKDISSNSIESLEKILKEL